MNKKLKVVRNYNDANVLLSKGYKMLKIDRDKFNRDYFVFIFEYSDELIKELKDLENKSFK